MSWATFLALLAFTGIAAWTPGPNNTILMASGLSHGFRRTVPMILGVGFGLPLMVALLGMGLSRVFDAAPQFYTAMKYAGAAYMLWLAWKIANAVPLRSDIKKTEPLTFLQGAAFQWVNPKGWVTSLTAIATYTTPSSYSQSLALVVLCCAFMSFTSSSAWALFGTALRGLMNNAKWFRAVNVTLAATLVLSLIPMLR